LVDVVKSSGAGGQALRERVGRLSRELDKMDQQVSKLRKAYSEAVASLAGLADPALPPQAQEAVERLKNETAKLKARPEGISAALGDLKTVLLSGGSKPASAKNGPQPEGRNAGHHVALALLEGLRLGDETFDADLEREISQISRQMDQEQVRPAMVRTRDLLDAWRSVQSDKLRQAENALMEVVAEVLTTEDELAQAVAEAHDGLSLAGDDFTRELGDTMGSLARDIQNSKNLDELKERALEHLRTIRDGVKSRREREQALLGATRRQLEQVRGNLGRMRERVRAAEKLSEELSQQALSDPLTGLWNKRALAGRLETTLSERELRPISLIIFDIDNFKGVNDRYGHQAGDRALVAIAQRAGASLRKQDELFRYAGDEFVALLYDTDADTAAEVAERVRQASQAIRFTYRGQGELRVTVSLGVAEAGSRDTPESLFERADQALLGAKRSGRNRVAMA